MASSDFIPHFFYSLLVTNKTDGTFQFQKIRSFGLLFQRCADVFHLGHFSLMAERATTTTTTWRHNKPRIHNGNCRSKRKPIDDETWPWTSSRLENMVLNWKRNELSDEGHWLGFHTQDEEVVWRLYDYEFYFFFLFKPCRRLPIEPPLICFHWLLSHNDIYRPLFSTTIRKFT